MNMPNIYLRAARLVAENKEAVCCNAIAVASKYRVVAEHAQDTFNWMFQPADVEACINYFGPINKQNREARTLALILMNEIELSGGL
jgi:hypothetical protein